MRRFVTFSNPQLVEIGAWSHAGLLDADQFNQKDAPVQFNPDAPDGVAFLDPYMKDGTDISQPVHEIHYYVMNAGTWKTTSVWPPSNTEEQSLFLRTDGVLSTEQPKITEEPDSYVVDFTASTGMENRWWTQMDAADVYYGDRAVEDRKLLIYTGSPVTQDIEIVGHPIVTLYVTSTHDDGACYAYLEDVSPDGVITYITESQIRALHRNVSTASPPTQVFGPYHSYLRADSEPMTPGKVTQLTFSLLPTAVLIKQGHALRLAIAGHDNSIFARIPEVGTPTIQVHHSPEFPSGLTLPVQPFKQ